MALTIWIMGQVGVAPTPEDIREYNIAFQERGHHGFVDFGSTRGDLAKRITIGLGYEYYIDRRFHGVSFEVLGQMLGPKLFKGPRDWWLGGGIAYWPIRPLKIFAAAGPFWTQGERLLRGRLGVGYRFLFFMVGIMPFVYVETTNNGLFTWSIGVRIQY